MFDPCGEAIEAVYVEQPEEYGVELTFSWEAVATGSGVMRLELLAEKVDGYRVAMSGTFNPKLVAVVITKGDGAGGISMDFGGVEVGQFAYLNGVLNQTEFDKVPRTAFGCRP